MALKQSTECFRAELYNPWSVFKALTQLKLGFYWYQSGTSSFLMKMLKDRQLDLTQLDGNVVALESTMMNYDNDGNYIAPLYQTGYLTIKDYDLRTDSYLLRMPNVEVMQAFNQNLLPYYSRIDLAQTAP